MTRWQWLEPTHDHLLLFAGLPSSARQPLAKGFACVGLTHPWINKLWEGLG